MAKKKAVTKKKVTKKKTAKKKVPTKKGLPAKKSLPEDRYSTQNVPNHFILEKIENRIQEFYENCAKDMVNLYMTHNESRGKMSKQVLDMVKFIADQCPRFIASETAEIMKTEKMQQRFEDRYIETWIRRKTYGMVDEIAYQLAKDDA